MRYPIIKVLFVALFTLGITLKGNAIEQPSGCGAEPYRQHLKISYHQVAQYVNEALASSYTASYAYLSETLYYLKEEGYHRDLAPLFAVVLSLLSYQIRQHQARLYLRAYMQNMNHIGAAHAVAAAAA